MELAAILPKQLFWYVSRSSGIVAWVLSVASIVWGLLMSTRMFGRRLSAPWMLELHKFLSTLTFVFVGIHIFSLAFDSYVHFGWSELFVPFASKWKSGPVAWGIVALYLLIAVELSSLVMKRLPKWLWRAIHLLSFPIYGIATVHYLSAGSDAHQQASVYAVEVSVAVVVMLTAYRVLMPPLRMAKARRSAALAEMRASLQKADH